MYALGHELRVGRRPSVPDLHVHSRADLDRVADELQCRVVLLGDEDTGGLKQHNATTSNSTTTTTTIPTTITITTPTSGVSTDTDAAGAGAGAGASSLDEAAIGGYLVFDSAELTKGRSSGIPTCLPLEESDLDPQRVRTIAKLFRGALMCGLFGFDVLKDAHTDVYVVGSGWPGGGRGLW